MHRAMSRRRALGHGAALLVAAAVPLPFTAEAVGANSLKPVRCPETECGHLYDPAIGEPADGIPPGIPFAELPDDWECPECGTPKYLW